MSKYIDAEKLIERLEDMEQAEYENCGGVNAKTGDLQEVQELIESLQPEQPDNWDEQYREDDLRTRFAFYTYKDEDGVLYLSNVFVEETSRNKGFGTKILQAAEKVAETIGAITIRLKVKQNSPANDWYRKYGYGYLTFEGEYDWLEKNLEYLKTKQEPEVDLDALVDGAFDKYSSVDGYGQLSVSFNRAELYSFIKKLARKEDK